MPIPRVTPRKLAIRDRRRRNPAWKYNPANPDMVVCTRLLMERGPGLYELVPFELAPAEMQEVSIESLGYADADSSKPNWDHDPLYFAAKKLRKRRRARQQKANR